MEWRSFTDQLETLRELRDYLTVEGVVQKVGGLLFNIYSHSHTVRVTWNDLLDRAGLRGYVQVDKYTHTISRLNVERRRYLQFATFGLKVLFRFRIGKKQTNRVYRTIILVRKVESEANS